MYQIYFIGVTLYMFRTVVPSIIRSYKTEHTATGMCQTDTAVWYVHMNFIVWAEHTAFSEMYFTILEQL